jgi:translation initiation factor 2 beta subunit (eIF-2beta)/eIF-5
METVESLVEELNQLCDRYIAYFKACQETDRIREVFRAIKNQGCNIVTPGFEPDSPEVELLSEEGKQDLQKLASFRKKKIEAINAQHLESSADFRDIEEYLERKIIIDFVQNTVNKHFILLKNTPNEVIFNDPDNQLIALFK